MIKGESVPEAHATVEGERRSAFLAAVRSALREQRIRARRSQADVARAVKCSRKRISDFELGLVDPGFNFVVGLAMELGFDLSVRCPSNPFGVDESLNVDMTEIVAI